MMFFVVLTIPQYKYTKQLGDFARTMLITITFIDEINYQIYPTDKVVIEDYEYTIWQYNSHYIHIV